MATIVLLPQIEDFESRPPKCDAVRGGGARITN